MYRVIDSWQEIAACRTADSQIFFSPEPQDQAAAIHICERCQVRLACLAYALEGHLQYGVWGGTTPEMRVGAGARDVAIAAGL